MKKYYKVKLMTIDNNQDNKTFKNDDMLDILLNSNLKEVDEIIVYKTLTGFKELITKTKIPAIEEEIAPYSTTHSYNLIGNQPVFFFCNVSTEKDVNKSYPSLDSLEASSKDVSNYLSKYISKYEDYDSKKDSVLYRLFDLENIFDEAKDTYNKILSKNGLVKNKVKRKERKNINNIIKDYSI